MKEIGKLVVVTGPMFSGKSTELLRLIERETISKRKFKVFNSDLDKRYGENIIATHSGKKLNVFQVKNSEEILKECNNSLNSIFIDEIQFFDSKIIEIINQLNLNGINVFCAGLNMTSEGKPFPFSDGKDNISNLICIADKVIRLYAVCNYCGEDANRTLYIGKKEKTDILVGTNRVYQPVCKKCWFKLYEK